MVFLLFSIFINVFLYVIFKEFNKYKINTLQAITVNYFLAFAMGIFISKQEIVLEQIIYRPWFIWSLGLGTGFIVIFNMLIYATQKGEVSMVSIFTKMSLVLPVIFGVLLYNESISWAKGIGIVLALVSIYFASKKDRNNPTNKKVLYIYIILFFLTGSLDTLLKYVENNYVYPKDLEFFTSFIFLSAGILGVIMLLVLRKKILLKNIFAGIALGIPNYFSIYFFIKVLKFSDYESSIVFLYNNVGIVIFSLVMGYCVYQEKLTKINWIGVALAVSSIIIVSIY